MTKEGRGEMLVVGIVVLWVTLAVIVGVASFTEQVTRALASTEQVLAGEQSLASDTFTGILATEPADQALGTGPLGPDGEALAPVPVPAV